MSDKSWSCCIVCDRRLGLAMPPGDDTGIVALYPAVDFQAAGNYGSTLFDPNPWGGSRTRIDVYICDWCLARKHSSVRLVVDDADRDFGDYAMGFVGPGEPPTP